MHFISWITEIVVFVLGILGFLLRDSFFPDWRNGFSEVLKVALYLLAILLLFFAVAYPAFVHGLPGLSRYPWFFNLPLFAASCLMVYYVVEPLARTAYDCFNSSPIDFFDVFRNRQPGRSDPGGVRIRTAAMARRLMEAKWPKTANVEYVRHQGLQLFIPEIRLMRMYLLKHLLVGLPALIFSFSLISLSGQNLGWWSIVKGGKAIVDADPLGSLLEHIYFCSSVVSTLGLGDTRPIIEGTGLGQVFVILMLVVFLLSTAVVFSTVISFTHSLFPAAEGLVSCIINDLSIQRPKPCAFVCHHSCPPSAGKGNSVASTNRQGS
jgi:hypothetical protein